jgi:hypothetical protein
MLEDAGSGLTLFKNYTSLAKHLTITRDHSHLTITPRDHIPLNTDFYYMASITSGEMADCD